MTHDTTPSESSKTARLVWIDIAKAIGIFFIIVGHLTIDTYSTAKYIYWFHVPFFFIVSGLLHSSVLTIPRFIAARFRHLMVPYCVMVCCALSMIVTGLCSPLSAKNLLLGGQYLAGTVCAKWWFIPCLFFTQVAGNFIIKTGRQRFVFYAACLCYYSTRMLLIANTVWIWGFPFLTLKLPLALEIVPMALVFYLVGFLLRGRFLSESHLPLPVTLLLAGAAAMSILLDWYNIWNVPCYSMIAQQYGLPLFNIAIPLIFFFLIREISIALSRFGPSKKILSSLGQAAMPIMFLHLILSKSAVRALTSLAGFNADSLILRGALCVLLPWGLYYLLKKFSITRKLALGEWH